MLRLRVFRQHLRNERLAGRAFAAKGEPVAVVRWRLRKQIAVIVEGIGELVLPIGDEHGYEDRGFRQRIDKDITADGVEAWRAAPVFRGADGAEIGEKVGGLMPGSRAWSRRLSTASDTMISSLKHWRYVGFEEVMETMTRPSPRQKR